MNKRNENRERKDPSSKGGKGSRIEWGAFLNEIIGNAAEGIIVYDRHLRYVVWNRFMEQLTGMPADQVLGKDPAALFPHIVERGVLTLLKRALIGETLYSEDIPYAVPHTGKKGWVSGMYGPHRNAAGQIIGVIGLVRDITDRKRMEEDLQKSQNRYLALTEKVKDLIWTLNLDLEFTFVSQAVKPLLGYSVAEALSKGLREILTPASFAFADSAWREELEKENEEGKDLTPSRGLKLEAVRKDGSKIWIEAKGTFLRDSRGKAIEILGVARDIMEYKEEEERLRRNRDQFRAFSANLEAIWEKERSRLARDIHDHLAQSLSALTMDLFLLGAHLSKEEKESRKRIERMSRLVEQLIGSVRKITAELRPAVLDDLGLTAAVEWQVQAFQKQTGIDCQFDPVWEDPGLENNLSTAVFRILQEILNNVARHAAATSVRVRLQKEGDRLVLEVRDDGKGIREKEIVSPKSLGLLGMRERAAFFDGEVFIHGVPGQGTRVVVRMPILGKMPAPPISPP